MSLFIQKPKQPKQPNEEGLANLFLEHAKGLKVVYDECPVCRGLTLHFVEVRQGRRFKLCDVCGTEQTEPA